MATILQENLRISITTPLGDGALRVEGMRGLEQMSGLFSFFVEAVSLDQALDFDAIIGQSATIKLTMAGGISRYFNGIVTRFTQGATDVGMTKYFLELRPWLWMLNLASDCRIYQAKTVPDILEELFGELGFTDFTNSLTATYTARDYCVQYRENALDFVTRIMEEEGIFYFFEHEDGKHTLVFADDPSAYPPCPELSEVHFERSSSARYNDSSITDCRLEKSVTTGKFALSDYNFKTPATSLLASAEGADTRFAKFDYPGKYTSKDAGDARARLRLESCEAFAEVLHGTGFAASFTPGHTFTLAEHDRDDVNTTYVVYAVTHSATQQSYDNEFEALPGTVPFRPPLQTPKPVVAGAQTALVVGKAGEEIWTDQYGRIVVQFYWDRKGVKDEKSSCWVRVAQGWAGKGWGAMFLPRIGQEVIVSFLDGDPDQPIVTGSVYNATQVVPYTLPTDQTKSTIKSDSSKGSAGSNELRFEDKADSEEVYMHAAKDYKLDVVHDSVTTIKNDRTTTIADGNDKLTVTTGNRTILVDTGNEQHDVKGTRAVKVTGDETHTDEANFTHNVTGDYVLKVTGNLTIEADGDVTIKSAKTVTAKAGTTLTNEAGTALKNKAGTALDNEAGTALTNKAGTSMTNEASVSLTNKGNASQTVEASGVVTVKGAMVKIN